MLSRLLDRPRAGGIVIEPMRHRHVGQALDIERTAYPKPWSARVFHDELDQVRDGTRYYLIARRGRTVVGYAGLMFVVDEAHVTNVVVHPQHRRTGIATRLLGRLAAAAIDTGLPRVDARGARQQHRRPGAVPHVRLRAGWRADPLLRGDRGRHRDVVPRHPVGGVRPPAGGAQSDERSQRIL